MTRFSSILRRATAGLGLILALTAAGHSTPTHAQFGFGIGPNMYFGGESERPNRECISNSQLRRSLSNQGYSNIFMAGGSGQIEVRAERRGVRYRLVVDACSGQILSRQRT